jgi:hypothetical protein
MHRGLPCVIGESGSVPLRFFRWWWCSPRFFNFYLFFVFYIYPYIIMNTHVMLMKNAKIIKVYYLLS